jgi:hypothetical protein
MRRPRLSAIRLRSGVVAVLAASGLISLASGCGGSGRLASPRATGPTDLAAEKLEAQSCSAQTSTASPHEVRHCEFELPNGRRFECNMASFRASAPTAGEVQASKSCVALRPAASGAVIEAIAKARACLRRAGLEVKGGPVPSRGHASGGPEGELIVGDALIGFYADPRSAQRAEPEVLRNAGGFGGKPERRGAVAVLWIRPPPRDRRARVLACVST